MSVSENWDLENLVWEKVSVSENLVSDKNVSVSVEILVPSVIIEQLIVHLRQTLQLKGSDDHHMMPGKMFE